MLNLDWILDQLIKKLVIKLLDRMSGFDTMIIRLMVFIPQLRDCVFEQNFIAYGLKFYAKKQKRNKAIDVLKAGGTRITLFLQLLK